MLTYVNVPVTDEIQNMAFVRKDYISTPSKYMDFNPLPCNCTGCSSKIPGLSVPLCHKMHTRNELLNSKQHEGPDS